MFWKDSSVEAAKNLLRWSISVTMVTLCLAGLLVWAAPSSWRLEAHQHYVQGYQRGRADAMKQQKFQSKNGATLLSQKFSKDYVRGYSDGYQLVNR